MVSGPRCFHASGLIGSARGPLFQVEYAQIFFRFLKPILRFGLYLGNERAFRLGMPQLINVAHRKYLVTEWYVLFRINAWHSEFC